VIRAYGGSGISSATGFRRDAAWTPTTGRQAAAELFNNCYRLYLREQWARMADALGRQEEARACRAELERLRPLVHEAFYDRDKERYVLDEQSYYLMPLMTGVVPAISARLF